MAIPLGPEDACIVEREDIGILWIFEKIRPYPSFALHQWCPVTVIKTFKIGDEIYVRLRVRHPTNLKMSMIDINYANRYTPVETTFSNTVGFDGIFILKYRPTIDDFKRKLEIMVRYLDIFRKKTKFF